MISRPLVPFWDLFIVLEAFSQHLFQPLDGVGLKFVLLKTVLLLAVTTAKCASNIQELSIVKKTQHFVPSMCTTGTHTGHKYCVFKQESNFQESRRAVCVLSDFSCGSHQRLSNWSVDAFPLPMVGNAFKPHKVQG